MSAIPQVLEELHRLLEAAERSKCQALITLHKSRIAILQDHVALTIQNEYFKRLEALPK